MRALALLLLAAVLAAATATAFDGTASHGPLAQASDGSIRVGERVLALADLDTLKLGEGPLPRTVGGPAVILRDGSRLPATAIAGAGPDRLAVRGPLGAVEVPLEAVAGWGDPIPPAAPGNDALLVESGLLKGRLLGIADGTLRFQTSLDPEPLALPFAAVKAARLDLRMQSSRGIRLRATDLALDLVVLPDGGIALAAAPTARIDPTVFGGMALRVEGGKRTYLSDLDPAEVREDGMFGVAWPHARDAAIAPGELLLGGHVHSKGITVHGPAMLAWRLDGRMARLRSQAGIADQLLPEGDCIAIISGDGRELWRARLRGGDAPRRLDLDVSGVSRLELRVEAGERHDIGDHVVLADAQLIAR